jgi:hypothetical protein
MNRQHYVVLRIALRCDELTAGFDRDRIANIVKALDDLA